MDQAVKDFEHGLDSILMDSVNTPELAVSFNKADAMSSSVSSDVIPFGAMLGHYFYLYHRQVKHLPVSKFIIFPAIQQLLDCGLLST